ncbi:MAG TPA: c-type cytochrome, partial [Azospira sp.]|nr:c-type cytochrome [Azospira sp.]
MFAMSFRAPRAISLLLACLGSLWLGGAQADEKGKEIYGPCAACHGEFGQGGKKGEYPRIAGQQAKYIESQLKAFQKRIRVNIPMVPYTEERELSHEDMKIVSDYIAGIELPTAIPVFKDT